MSLVFCGMMWYDIFKDIDVDRGYVTWVIVNDTLISKNLIQHELWNKVLLLCTDKPIWCGVALVIEICLWAPCSNGKQERFSITKTDQWPSPSLICLNSILRSKFDWHQSSSFIMNMLTKLYFISTMIKPGE